MSGEGSPSFTIVQLPYRETQALVSATGLSIEVFQRLWLSVLFAGAAACVTFFAFGLVDDPIVAGAAGLFASFNAYRMVTAADPIPLAAVCSAALLGGLLLRADRDGGEVRRVAWFGLCSLSVGYVSVNPPHTVLVVAWVLASFMFGAVVRGRAYAFAALRFLAKAVPVALILNLWWIVPAILTLLEPGFASRFAAASPREWAWGQERASFLNAFAMNTTWGWSHPEYYPFAADLDHGASGALRYFLPSLALFGVVLNLRSRTRLVLALAGAWGATLWVAKGYHPPLGGVNAWFYDHVPGFWLLRDPAKVMTITLMIVGILAGLGIARLLRPLRDSRRWPSAFLAATLVFGSLAYVRPLFTGAVIPDQRPLLPSAHVIVPDAWSQAAEYLDSLPTAGKVLVMPVADYYQLPTTWGYYGAPFMGWLIDKPVIELAPDGYFNPYGSVTRLVRSTEEALLSGRNDRVLPLLRAVGVRYVLVRRDLDPSFPGRHLAAPEAIARGLDATQGIAHLRSFGILDVYEVDLPQSGEVVTARPFDYEGSMNAIPGTLAALPADAALVSGGNDRNGPQTSVLSEGGRIGVIRAEGEHLLRLEARSLDGKVLLRLMDPLIVTVGGHALPPVPTQRLRFGEPELPVVLSIGSERFILRGLGDEWGDLGLVRIGGKTTLRLDTLKQPRSIDLHSAGPVSNCRRYDDRTTQEVGLSSAIVDQDGVPTLRLTAADHSACVSYPIQPFESAAAYELSLEYRSVEGSPARLCVYELPSGRCIPLPSLETDHGWHRFQATVEPDASSTELQLFLYADGTGSGQTVTKYRRLKAASRLLAGQHEVLDMRPPVADVVLPPGRVPVEITDTLKQPRSIDLHSAGPVSNCRRYDDRTTQEVGLSSAIVDQDGVPTLRLTAADHSACVSYPIQPFESAAAYELSLEYRSVEGSPARLCVYELPSGRCIPLPSLETDHGWHRFQATVEPDASSTELQLFLYADGTGSGQTVTEYRAVTTHAAAPIELVTVKDLASPPPPSVAFTVKSPSEVHVRVTRSSGLTLLVLAEAYASGWGVSATGHDTSSVQHVLVNGYSNGWLIPWKGSYELTISYEPERLAHVARVIDLVLLPVVLVGALVGRRRPSHRARRLHFRSRRDRASRVSHSRNSS